MKPNKGKTYRDACKKFPARTLPKGWIWTEWDDGSGSLGGPNNERYFQYDQQAYAAFGGIEYRKYTDLSSCWNAFWGSFTEYKAFAEAAIQEMLSEQT